MEFQVNIVFLFQKQASFDNGLAALRRADPPLADYLGQTRKVWSEHLVESRNAMHEGWMLPRVKYSEAGGRINVDEPHVAGQGVTAFVRFMLDRLSCFVEELTVHCLQRRLPQGITVTEIPLSRRAEEAPERFRVTLANGGLPPWTITFHQSSFEET